MDNRKSPPLTCRYCQHYQFEGRRGGHCQTLGVHVKGEWGSCSQIKPAFTNYSNPKIYGIKIGPYISDIRSYETAAQLKSSGSRDQIAS